jgi:glyoxylase-like metal-dependent hydrolase (beta-lactamase superfamily II)
MVNLKIEKNGFEIFEILPEVYQIRDAFGACASLIIGTKKAILFDTMNGIGDLKGLVETLTSVPLMVINSHGHVDHVGGNYQFEQIYLNQKDWSVLETNRSILQTIEINMNQKLVNCMKSLEMTDHLVDIQPGTMIDLGNRSVKVIALEGHTKGSIGLLLTEESVLFAGDAFTPQMCLFFPESLTVEEYQKMILRTMQEEFDQYVLGHYVEFFPKSYLEKMLECSKLVEQKAKSFHYEYSLLPEYKGRIYIYDMQDPLIQSVVCIISKEE